MIIDFSIQNFGSIKDKQTLSFEADKSTRLEDAYIIDTSETNGIRLLKLALIYGSNASGKTTILKALDFLRDIVLEPESKKTDKLDFKPFLFDENTPNQNSAMEINFIQNKVKYYYKVEFSQMAIDKEELFLFSPRKTNVYKRQTDLSNQYTKITFGDKIKIDKTNLEANTLWNNTVLGGCLKTNIDVKELHEVIDWFKNYLSPLIYTRTQLEGFITSQIDKEEISKADVINILKKADLNISDIVIQKKEEDIPEGFIDLLKKQKPTSDNTIKELEEKGKIMTVDTKFEHTVNDGKYSLPLKLESQGTRRYYGFAGLLALLIKDSTAFPIDELEASLHPDLYVHFLLSFLLNSKKSQVIATTHNREILGNKNIFRNDAIWFTDKSNKYCSTELYSLADFDSSVIRKDTTNVLNAYNSGKLKGIPNLGDNFIELNP